MGFLEKITGNDMTKEFKSFEDRVKKLPIDYQKAWEEIKENIWEYSDFTGRNLIPVFESIIDMFEETATNGKSVDEVLGDNIKEFCSDLAREEVKNTFRDKLRKQLNKKIAKKIGE